MRKKTLVGLSALSIALLLLLLIGFMAVPPTPALPDENVEAFQYNEYKGSDIPSSFVVTYTNPEAFVAIVTIRTFAMTDYVYSKALRQTKPLLENFAKEKYHKDIEVRLIAEKHVDVHGHRAVRQEYEIRWEDVANTGPILECLQEYGDVYAKMVLLAWFCHEDFKTICVGYVYLPVVQEPTEKLVTSIQNVNSESVNLVPSVAIFVFVNIMMIVIIKRKIRW